MNAKAAPIASAYYLAASLKRRYKVPFIISKDKLESLNACVNTEQEFDLGALTTAMFDLGYSILSMNDDRFMVFDSGVQLSLLNNVYPISGDVKEEQEEPSAGAVSQDSAVDPAFSSDGVASAILQTAEPAKKSKKSKKSKSSVKISIGLGTKDEKKSKKKKKAEKKAKAKSKAKKAKK